MYADWKRYENLVLGYRKHPVLKPLKQGPGSIKFQASVAPSARHITIPTDPKQDPLHKVHCGTCNNPAYAHPVFEVYETAFGPDSELVCDRVPADILNSVTASDWLDTADYDTRTGASVVDSDYSNAYLERGSDLDPEEYKGHDLIWNGIDRYRDNSPVVHVKDKETGRYSILSGEYTGASHAWLNAGPVHTYFAGKAAEYDDEGNLVKAAVPPCKEYIGNVPGRFMEYEQSRNVYFPTEDSHAGITVHYYDPHLTELSANRMLNFYVDKRTGSLRVGGVELHRDYAQCVQHRCKKKIEVAKYKVTNEDGTPNWEAREQYVLDIIRHGNNHAASWFVNRPEYYKVHTDYCDLACDPKASHCGTIEEVVTRSLSLLASVLNTSPIKAA